MKMKIQINDALKYAEQKISAEGLFNWFLDAEIILSFVLKKNKEFLLTYPEKKISNQKWRQFKKLIARRAKKEPVAHIVGHKEFFGLDFLIDKNTLIPRPETEMMVEETINRIKRHGTKNKNLKKIILIDVGTGSGCVPIAIAKNISNKNIKLFAIDISPQALQIANKNAARHKIKIKLLQDGLLNPFIQKSLFFPSQQCIPTSKPRLPADRIPSYYPIITANLPYLSYKIWRRAMQDVKKFEPKTALISKEGGLKHYRLLLEQIKKARIKDGLVFLEIDPAQKNKIQKLIKKILPTAAAQIKKDLSGKDRLVIISL